ncbi:ABC transporter permease [Sediminibacillus halophilus]|uniref:Putative aldouronate transport system permease protein n=1 Tax=Sediminibacillus halophilus TaxID=482461 RepID=A0A1G9RUI5_9BACI|nr:ABC transporter permease subunit [Sediminibacillus halophilus]SDM26657.1 putative aldouronate transport system permease protein [Sediminibacillus halophilus]
MTSRKLALIWKHKALYLIALPGIAYFIIFKYIPIMGSVIAFQDYNIFQGITGSAWVGLEQFERMFQYPEFLRILKNTLLINLYDIVFGFSAPIILALMLNEVRKMLAKRIIQTIVYMPHFLSWVIISGIFIGILSPSTGMVNHFLNLFGIDSIYFLGEDSFIRTIIVGSGMWRETGWSTIIYLAALAGINPQLYEAADIDGANRWQQTWKITIPTLMPTIMMLFLLQIGNFLDFGFERVDVFLNPFNRVNGEIFDTYIYEAGLLQNQYSYTTAIGIFKSVVGLILLVGANFVSRKTTGNSLY